MLYRARKFNQRRLFWTWFQSDRQLLCVILAHPFGVAQRIQSRQNRRVMRGLVAGKHIARVHFFSTLAKPVGVQFQKRTQAVDAVCSVWSPYFPLGHGILDFVDGQ